MKAKQLIWRVVFYIVGQFILAFGVAFAANSNLGVSPVNSFPFAIAAISGLTPGLCVSIVFCCYVLIQIVILRKDFKVKYFLEAAYAYIFGRFVDLAKFILGSFTIPTYAGQLVMLAISILLIAVGISLYLGADIVPMPMEGLTLAITQKLGGEMSFHNMKVILDCASVVCAVLVLLIGLGPAAGFAAGIVREGTIVTALAVGPAMGLLAKFLKPWMRKLCFSAPEKEAKLQKAANAE